jgi:hypothetical protein
MHCARWQGKSFRSLDIPGRETSTACSAINERLPDQPGLPAEPDRGRRHRVSFECHGTVVATSGQDKPSEQLETDKTATRLKIRDHDETALP